MTESPPPSDPAWGRWLVLALLIAKLGVTAWNCAVFDGITYDQTGLHVPRARDAGLAVKGRAYNPPLYYVPAYPIVVAQERAAQADPVREPPKARRARRKARDADLLLGLRWSNLGHLALFYGCWLFVIIPRLFKPWSTRLVLSLLLLALPGYQKLAAMVHPDNALTSATAVCLALWLWLRERRAKGEELRNWWVMGLAVAAGLAGLTRPFGALTTGAFWVATLLVVWESVPRGTARVGRIALATALAVGIGGSWVVAQYAHNGKLSPVYSQKYIEPYAAHRAEFDRVGYFTSFYIADLLRRPNRKIFKLDKQAESEYENRYGNSFFTLAYSEIWGDHWLYFSGKWKKEKKAQAKSVLMGAALPTIPWLGFRFFAGAWIAIRRIRDRAADAKVWLFMLSFMSLALGLFVYWQLTGGLTPGKNSGVKFIYNAYWFPIPLAIAMLPKMSRWERNLAIAYILLLFGLSLPFIWFSPS